MRTSKEQLMRAMRPPKKKKAKVKRLKSLCSSRLERCYTILRHLIHSTFRTSRKKANKNIKLFSPEKFSNSLTLMNKILKTLSLKRNDLILDVKR